MDVASTAADLAATLEIRIAAYGRAGVRDVEDYRALLETAAAAHPPPWPADDPPPLLPTMDPANTWSTADLEAIEAHRSWAARQAQRRSR